MVAGIMTDQQLRTSALQFDQSSNCTADVQSCTFTVLRVIAWIAGGNLGDPRDFMPFTKLCSIG